MIRRTLIRWLAGKRTVMMNTTVEKGKILVSTPNSLFVNNTFI